MTQPTHPTQTPPVPAGPIHSGRPEDTKTHPKPTEPGEVLGRHKNSGQKDHKGAR